MSKFKSHDGSLLILLQKNIIDSVGEYFVSRERNKFIRKVPECDAIGRGPGLHLWHAYFGILKAREKMKEIMKGYENNRHIMDDSWDALNKSESVFRESFIKFNQFICENEDKCKRASHKQARDEETLKLITTKVNIIHDDLIDISFVCKEMEQWLEKYSIYEKFLIAVVQQYNEFSHSVDIIRRYEALTSAKQELFEEQEEKLSDLENAISQMSKIMDNKKIHMTKMNDEFASLKKQYECVKNESKWWENVLNKIKNETTRRELEFSQVCESLWLLYKKICKDKGILPSCKKIDYECQLITVMRGITEVKNIVLKSKEKMARDQSSEEVQKSNGD